jgi:hypothetical protein
MVSTPSCSNDPAELLETFLERRGAELSLRIVLRVKHQHTDPPYPGRAVARALGMAMLLPHLQARKENPDASWGPLSFVRPRRRLSSAPTADFRRRRAQKLSRPAVAPP